ncbi:MAG TPA: TonB-dependent receptor, partial [Prolixibacteraceae bacterium]|nr:TonB-dependent receptor [Prolixibacteraceae bacterium]
MMKIWTTAIIFLITIGAWAQKATLSGVVTDGQTGETLVNATIILNADDVRGVITNENGFFSLPGIEKQQFQISVSFMGYQTLERQVNLRGKTSRFIEVELQPSDIEVEQVVVMGEGPEHLGDRDVEISHHTLTPKAIKSIPTARNDVFKALRYLPGIEPTEPLSPLVSVRGSDPGENLIMLDGVTIYNPYHFISSTGIFNMQTVKNVDMMVGGFGAEYGGRNSSVINIATKDGNNSELHGEIHPSSTESKVFLEFPVGEKTTMMAAGRFNYDIPGNFLLYSNNYFYDVNLSLTHRFNARNRITLKYFGSRDRTNLDFNNYYKYIGNSLGMEDVFNDMRLEYVNQWSNNIATAIYRSVLSPKVFLRAQVSASLHRADNSTEMDVMIDDVGYDTSTLFKSRVDDYTAKMSISYKPFFWNEIKAGADYSNYRFMNGSELNGIDNGSAQKRPDLFAFFAEDKITAGMLTVRPGLRVTRFNGGEYLYEPRMNLVLNLPRDFKIQAAYGLYKQYIVSMNTQEFEFNQFLDYYYPLINHRPSVS